MVMAVSRDQAQLRMLIYEFARTKLRKDLYKQYEELGWKGIAERVLALEAAIDRVESDFTRDPALLSVAADALPAHASDIYEESTSSAIALVPGSAKEMVTAEYMPPILPSFLLTPTRPTASVVEIRSEIPAHSSGSYGGFWWSVQLVLAVILGVAIYAAIDGRGGLLAPRASTNVVLLDPTGLQGSSPKTTANTRPGIPGVPIPTSYGVYAISNGKLTELGILPIRVPDPRVAISPTIVADSTAHLPSDPVQFIVFRRDLENNAPDRVPLRVVAQIVRALSFDSAGKANVARVDRSWVVRSNSYDLRVAPVPDDPEMILIRPDPAGFLFPAGRYALVLKDTAYDFTIDGPLTDPAHCLERTDAVNVPVYTECRSP
jgi:hypothetical protein